MHVNYCYVLEKCLSLTLHPSPRILDYGCGAGEIVEAGISKGLDIYGVETFYEGGNTRETVRAKGLLGNQIKEIENGRIPFSDGSFDLVVSNQVFEHLPDMETVLSEIDRVLARDGVFLCLFPSRDVIREGHCGIPLIHWFPKGSHYRYYYILVLRCIGLGYHKGNKSPSQWSYDFLAWLDQFTFYRSRQTILEAFSKHFPQLHHIEDDYIAYRLGARNLRLFSPIARLPVFNIVTKRICRKLGGMVIVGRKS